MLELKNSLYKYLLEKQKGLEDLPIKHFRDDKQEILLTYSELVLSYKNFQIPELLKTIESKKESNNMRVESKDQFYLEKMDDLEKRAAKEHKTFIESHKKDQKHYEEQISKMNLGYEEKFGTLKEKIKSLEDIADNCKKVITEQFIEIKNYEQQTSKKIEEIPKPDVNKTVQAILETLLTPIGIMVKVI